MSCNSPVDSVEVFPTVVGVVVDGKICYWDSIRCISLVEVFLAAAGAFFQYIVLDCRRVLSTNTYQLAKHFALRAVSVNIFLERTNIGCPYV